MAKKPGRGVDAKGRSKRRGKFVALGNELLTSAAWRSLPGSAIKYYVELRRRFNGWNNGEIHLTADECKTLFGMSKHTVIRAQLELQEKGLIHMTRRGGFHQHLATTWALTDEPTGTRPPTHAYKTWTRNSFPRCQNCTPDGAETAPLRRSNGPRGAETAPVEANSTRSRGAKTAPILDIYHVSEERKP